MLTSWIVYLGRHDMGLFFKISLLVLIISTILVKWFNVYDTYFNIAKERNEGDSKVFSAEELSLYDGVSRPALYLAILGRVFDVSAGRTHYAPGAAYHAFLGGDRSRWFVTGVPDSPSAVHDARAQQTVSDLSCSELTGLRHWLTTYYNKYTYKGKVVGLFYDESGERREETELLEDRLNECEGPEGRPGCNLQWSANKGSRVWCSPTSGGVTREWAGVPRREWVAGRERCACVERGDEGGALRAYTGCDPAAHECFLDADPA